MSVCVSTRIQVFIQVFRYIQMTTKRINFLPMNLIIKTTMWNASPYHNYNDDNEATGGHIQPQPEPSHDPALHQPTFKAVTLEKRVNPNPLPPMTLHQDADVEVSEDSAVTAETSISSHRHFRQ
jgi:hypothetical protein